MAGRRRRAKPGEATCTARGCPRPAGLGTATPGHGPCLRHGGFPPGTVPPLLDPVACRLTGKGRPATNPRAVLRVVLASAARQGCSFEEAWRIAAPSALAYLNDADAEALWAELRADEPEWRDAYGYMFAEGTRPPPRVVVSTG